ncbi:MAG: hypothetical protein IJA72_03385 [Clostridia bacterium]|nr:hypothetical protein [Clostridia bacterium]
MRKSKRVVFYSLMICFAFLIAVVVAVGNIKPKAEEEIVKYNIAIDGPSRIEFEYQPDSNAGASLYKVYEYAFGNEMDQTLRVMLGADNEMEAENVTVGYFVSGSKTIINDDFKFSSALSAVDINPSGQKWVYIKITVENKEDLATYKKDIKWIGGKPVDTYIKVNGVNSVLPSISTGESALIDYSQALAVPKLQEGEIFAGWYSDPFCTQPIEVEDVTVGGEVYANIYTPSTVTEDMWNAPETYTYDGYVYNCWEEGDYAFALDMYASINDNVTIKDKLYIPETHNGTKVTSVKLGDTDCYEEIYIPKTVSYIDIYYRGKDVKFYVDPENPYYVMVDDIYLIARASRMLIGIFAGSAEDSEDISKLVIPEGVMEIGNGHWAGVCDTNLTIYSITIPLSVTRINRYSFDNTITEVIFKDVSTWYTTASESDYLSNSGGVKTSVSNPATNAYNLTETYDYYYWYKLDE